ncbi:DUF6879 family protein [Streptacidiphilus sp. MAP5-3]|uniref:DUF6879 family protein n=1 Tax=unclassified Streptacidiphilus TaxID=2643834 RepID=UPI0035172B1F
MQPIPGDQITEFFETGFQLTAWRLETRQGYAADQRSQTYKRWLDGQPLDIDADSAWYALMRRITAQGKRVERVRVIDQPPTENQRYSLASVPVNLTAGEDIRYLWRADAARLELPKDDLWLFDSRFVATFAWDDTGWATHLDVTDDPAVVLAACQARDAAWRHAIRYADFRTAVASIG